MPRKLTDERSGILRLASPAGSAAGAASVVWAMPAEQSRNKDVRMTEIVPKLLRSNFEIQRRRGESARPGFRPAHEVSINSSRGFNSRVEGACKFIARQLAMSQSRNPRFHSNGVLKLGRVSRSAYDDGTPRVGPLFALCRHPE